MGQENRATEDVTFSDIVIRTRLIGGGWWGKAEPIYIAVQPCAPGIPCGVRVKNVVFNNITAEAENGSLLLGSEGTPLTGIEIERCSPAHDRAQARVSGRDRGQS